MRKYSNATYVLCLHKMLKLTFSEKKFEWYRSLDQTVGYHVWIFFDKQINICSVALLSHNTLKWSVILGLSFFAWCWWPRESMLWGSSALSEFHTSLSKVLTLCHCVKLKQRYLITYPWTEYFRVMIFWSEMLKTVLIWTMFCLFEDQV